MNIFNAEILTEFFRDQYLLFLGFIFLGTLIATWYIIPKIIWVSKEKKLMKPIIGRSVHVEPVPTFGGVAFFITLILSMSLVQMLPLGHVGNNLIPAITILFMVGLKDDLVVSTARVKLIGQFLAIGFLVFTPELELSNLHGFLGIQNIPVWLGYPIAAFILLAIINSYNLIDGIDGLAAIVGIIIGLVYTSVFYYTNEPFYVLVSISLVGILSGFLHYNFSNGAKKIFMGDSGALVIGLLIGLLSLRLLTMDASLMTPSFLSENRFLFALAVLFIPFFDTTRSILMRLLTRKNPFEGDKKHIHHVLLDMGLSHKRASLFLGLFNVLVIGLFALLSYSFDSGILTVLMTVLFFGSCWGIHILKNRFSQDLPVLPLRNETNSSTNDTVDPAKIGIKFKRKHNYERVPDKVLDS